MSTLAYRRSSIQRALSSYLAPAAGYSVVVLKPGAQVSGTQSSVTAITVRTGHGVAAGDKVCLVSGGALTAGSVRTVSSVTTTAVTVGVAISVTDGDYLVNIGTSDAGVNDPAWNGSEATIYSDMAGGTSIGSSTVTTDSGGEYEYWTRSHQVAEVILSSGTVYDYLPYVFMPEDNVVYAHRSATGGVGSASSPWTGWESVVTKGSRIHFVAGYYSTGSSKLTINPDNTGNRGEIFITGDGFGNTIISADNTDNEDGIVIKMDTGESHITIRDVAFMKGTAALASGKALLNLDALSALRLDNVAFISANATYGASGCALRLSDVNNALIDNIFIGRNNYNTYTVPLWAMGVDINPGVSYNRGNITFVNGLLLSCLVGMDIASGATNVVNNVQMYGTKFVGCNDGTGEGISGSIGVRVANYAQNVLLSGCHFEVFERAFYSNSTCRNVGIHNCLFSLMTPNEASIDLDGGTQNVTIMNNRFLGADSDELAVRISSNANNKGIMLFNNYYLTMSATPVSDSSGGTACVEVDIASSGEFRFKGHVKCDKTLSLPDASTLTIDTGAVTITGSYHFIAGEGGVADDLDTINGGYEGAILVIRAVSETVTITCTEAGNLKLAGSFALDHVEDTLTLLGTAGGNWVELSRSDNEA